MGSQVFLLWNVFMLSVPWQTQTASQGHSQFLTWGEWRGEGEAGLGVAGASTYKRLQSLIAFSPHLPEAVFCAFFRVFIAIWEHSVLKLCWTSARFGRCGQRQTTSPSTLVTQGLLQWAYRCEQADLNERAREARPHVCSDPSRYLPIR